MWWEQNREAHDSSRLGSYKSVRRADRSRDPGNSVVFRSPSRTGSDGHRHDGLPRSRYTGVHISTFYGISDTVYSDFDVGTAGGWLGQTQTPMEGGRDKKTFEKSQESRRNGSAGRRAIWVRRYEYKNNKINENNYKMSRHFDLNCWHF